MSYTKSEEFAVQTMVDAYFACNAALSPIGGDSGLAWEDSRESPMGLLSQAIKYSLMRMGFSYEDARTLWDHMISNGEGVEYNINQHMVEKSKS